MTSPGGTGHESEYCHTYKKWISSKKLILFECELIDISVLLNYGRQKKFRGFKIYCVALFPDVFSDLIAPLRNKDTLKSGNECPIYESWRRLLISMLSLLRRCARRKKRWNLNSDSVYGFVTFLAYCIYLIMQSLHDIFQINFRQEHFIYLF